MPKRIESRPVYQGKVIHVRVDRVQLSHGHSFELDIVEHPGAAAVVPVDATGQVHLVRQARHASGRILLEIPAGKLDAGEAPETCARRELEEETGQVAGKLQPLGAIWTTPGFCNERIWLFLATELRVSQQRLDPEEVITVERMPFAQAVTVAAEGGIEDAKSICGLLRAAAALR